jgi:hypothetical protein
MIQFVFVEPQLSAERGGFGWIGFETRVTRIQNPNIPEAARSKAEGGFFAFMR